MEVGDDEECPATTAESTSSGSKSKERQRESKAAEALKGGDYVHEQEGDLSKAQAALESVTSSGSNANAKTQLLFSGVLAQEDIALIMDECDFTKEMATQLLQENQGSVAVALKAFVRQ